MANGPVLIGRAERTLVWANVYENGDVEYFHEANADGDGELYGDTPEDQAREMAEHTGARLAQIALRTEIVEVTYVDAETSDDQD